MRTASDALQVDRRDTNDRALTKATQAFQRWRATRPRGERIPEALWESAVDTASKHGVSRAANALKLDYYGLKRRLDEIEGGQATSRSAAGMMFVELPLLATSSTIACAIEIEHADEDSKGSKLRVELDAITAADLGTLVLTLSGHSS